MTAIPVNDRPKEELPIYKDPRYTSLVKDYRYKLNKQRNHIAGVYAVLLSLVTSPFYTMATAMQLSVIPHLTIYGDVSKDQLKKTMGQRVVGRFKELTPFRSSSSTALIVPKVSSQAAYLMDISNQMINTNTKGELSRAVLNKASGQVGLNQVYRAPVYQTYGECVQGLYRQGILGFYKGNGFRLAHIYLYELNRIYIQKMLDSEQTIVSKNSFFKDFAAAFVASLYLHPLHWAEARYILNNRIPAFQSYKSLYTMGFQSGHQVFNGITVHLPRSLLISLAGFNYFRSANYQTYMATQLAFTTAAYPLLTIQRRLECQSPDRAGMIPMRYEGAVHCAGLMLREEGIRGLYRGYVPYIFATAIYWSVIPMMSEMRLQQQPISGNYKDETGELLEQVTQLRGMAKSNRRKED